MDIKKFNKGEMYWYINPEVDKKDFLTSEGENRDFLDNRPVLIISEYVDSYNSSVIVVPTTTSSHRYGIDITMPNDKGEPEFTNIMPMRIRSVPVNYLKKYIGKINDDILDKVYSSLDYHLGRSDVIPDYVNDDIQIHEKINNYKNEVQKNKEEDNRKESEDMSNEKYSFSDELEKLKNSLVNIIDYRRKDDNSIMGIVYAKKKCSKTIKRKYNSLTPRQKFLYLQLTDEEISKSESIPMQLAIMLKKLSTIEIAVRQLIMIDSLIKHELVIKNLSNMNKMIFVSINNSTLNTIIKKGDPCVNKYKNQFIKDLNLCIK